MTAKITSRTASAAVTIDGVTPISRLMFARRIACQTISAIASSPAIRRRRATWCLSHHGWIAGPGVVEPVEEREEKERDRGSEDDFAP